MKSKPMKRTMNRYRRKNYKSAVDSTEESVPYVQSSRNMTKETPAEGTTLDYNSGDLY